ncbi:ABC transporter ATP-binding protein [Tepidimicrobium xylanilyticum]|uniref:Putative ABC transport system ATP-binding protein n=1 Tax=Tepidimicrobium xylanilyticum TaxID=1123352 RepID=A0A1H2XI88_9FIRM|nr:ABC transporter ATP-binding protein [Tepidimicrobium xylanilyticum]GMG97493.1 peptide ABC transporter ATP-binding protein [Tepidimicrobium xylanilyticum]SDW91969.1 putative ABC transport system ATP-binding protein [Tepidimicrobium xylanilyticum]
MEIVIETRNLRKEYGSKGIVFAAIDGIDLKVYKGEFLGIMGPSGAGKTTLLNVLSTIDRPTSGNIYYKGKDILTMKNRELSIFRRNNIGFLFQDFNLLDNMSIQDNIALPLALSKVGINEIKEKVEKLSSFFGLKDQLKKYPYQLSGGQKQRVAAARAIITSPSIVFADEPTGALDSKSSQDLLHCLLRMNEELNTTIIMVTHDAFAASYCKRILYLKDGKIHGRLDKDSSRKEFFRRIIDFAGSMGGGVGELL